MFTTGECINPSFICPFCNKGTIKNQESYKEFEISFKQSLRKGR